MSLPSTSSSITMEKLSGRTLFLVEPIGLLFLNTLLILVTRLHKASFRLISFLKPHPEQLILSSKEAQKPKIIASTPDIQISRMDVGVVMDCMGIRYSPEGEQLKETMGFHELSGMFEEKEPNLEEVKEAFVVFDENCDGFIDAMELQSVLSKLGFVQGQSLENCHRMIEAHDDNRDGRIDFTEFVNFMENSFC